MFLLFFFFFIVYLCSSCVYMKSWTTIQINCGNMKIKPSLISSCLQTLVVWSSAARWLYNTGERILQLLMQAARWRAAEGSSCPPLRLSSYQVVSETVLKSLSPPNSFTPDCHSSLAGLGVLGSGGADAARSCPDHFIFCEELSRHL